jgi:hypothetical protein
VIAKVDAVGAARLRARGPVAGSRRVLPAAALWFLLPTNVIYPL